MVSNSTVYVYFQLWTMKGDWITMLIKSLLINISNNCETGRKACSKLAIFAMSNEVTF